MNGSMDSRKQILITRDAKRFRKTASPLAPLASHFHGLLSAQTSQGAALRTAFAHAAAGKREIGKNLAQYDQTTLDVVANMPSIVTVQGNLKTDRLLETKETVLDDSASSDSRSMTSSTLSIGVVPAPDLTETLLLPYTLHQNLQNAVKDRDEAEKTKLSMMALACVIYETAHWISLKVHGYRTDHSKEHVSTDEWSHRPEDVGTIALQAVLGHHLKLVTWADGESELVCRYIKTVAERASITGGRSKPLLQPAFIAHIIGGPLPPIKDVTGQPMAGFGDKPAWSGRSTLGTIVSIVTPASTCHHVHSSLLGIADK